MEGARIREKERMKDALTESEEKKKRRSRQKGTCIGK